MVIPFLINGIYANLKQREQDLISALFVGIGAFFGALSRWGIGSLLNPLFISIPMGTLAANWLGGLLMGIMLVLAGEHTFIPPQLRLGIITGFLGSLTTFSTFSAEALSLLSRAEYLWFTLLLLLHVCGSIGMVIGGYAVMKWIIH